MIFKRAVETTYKLKFESSRKLLSVVENNFFTFPWAFNVFDNVEENIVMKTDVSNLKAVARQGIVECVQHELMHPYPVMTERKNEFVAQFKYTVAVRKEGPIILAGNQMDVTKYNSEFKIADEVIYR